MFLYLILLHLAELGLRHHHCTWQLIHYDGTFGHPGFWRTVLICPVKLQIGRAHV